MIPCTSYPFLSSSSARYEPSCPVIPVMRARFTADELTLSSLLGQRVARPLRVAFDVSQTGFRKAGCGFYAESLNRNLRNFCHNIHLHHLGTFGADIFNPLTALQLPTFQTCTSSGPRHFSRNSAKLFWSNRYLVEQSLSNCDIIHSNNFWSPTWKPHQKFIYTIYDTSFLDYPDWHNEKNRFICFKGMQRASIYADHFVAISQSTKQNFLNFFPYVDPEAISVVYPASRFSNIIKSSSTKNDNIPRRFKRKFLASKDFFLSVGTLEPRKNQLFLLKAYDAYRKLGGKPIPLVFAGGKGWLIDEFLTSLSVYKWRQDVHLLGYVSDHELSWLYKNCLVNLYPSFYEGFGLPVLEGLSFGAPTITSNSSSLPEVIGHAGFQLSPFDHLSWAKSMYLLASDLNANHYYSRLAIKRSYDFSWTLSCSKLVDIYQELADSPSNFFTPSK